MNTELLPLLKLHDYFRTLSDEVLQEIAGIARVTRYDAGDIVHEAGQFLTSVYFVMTGRLKSLRVDSHDREHLLRTLERGDQHGLLVGAIDEALPIRLIALEPSTVLALDYELSMELMFKHPDLRRRWLRTVAQGLQRHFLGANAPRAPNILAVIHESPATRHVARKLIERLSGLGEEIGVLSDTDAWRSIADVRFRSLSDGSHHLESEEIRQQFAEWHQTRRIVIDVAAGWNAADSARLMGAADRVLWLVPTNAADSAAQRMQAIDVLGHGWRDKISVVWVLGEGERVSPVTPNLRACFGRDFKLTQTEACLPWGPSLSNGLERLVHYLRGVRIGVALGGGAARGMSHLGVLKALEQNGIIVDEIAGTSAGAMTGIIYSAGLDCDYSASEFATALRLPWIFRRMPSGDYWYLLYKYRRGHFQPMLRKYLRDWTLEQLPLPCHAVTVDLIGGKSVVRSCGNAIHAVLESINLPGLSRPICRDGQALIDGGLVNNIPADVLISQGCNFVIAVSVTAKIEHRLGENKPDTPTTLMKIPSTLKTLFRSLLVQNHNLNAFGVKDADVVIEPDVTGFDLTEFMRARELAAVGEKTATDEIPKLKRLLTRLDPQLFPFRS